MRTLASVLAAVVALPSASCQFGYVWTQSWGQLRVSREQTALDDPELLARLTPLEREKVAWIERVLSFGRDELGLEPGDAYTTYFDTDDEPISTIVTAAHPLSLEPFRWRFPFVGRVAYKGFFDPADAREEAERLRARGFEVKLSSVGAFSTLGWFRDPILSTMLDLGLADLADLILHECTHRTVYFQGETSFNESLASHVAYEGTLRFLARHPELAAERDAYVLGNRLARQREELVRRLRADLEALYASSLPDARKLAVRRELYAMSAAGFARLAPGASPAAFPRDNAAIASLTSYHAHRPELERLQEALGGEPRALVAFAVDLPSDVEPLAALEERLAQLARAADNREEPHAVPEPDDVRALRQPHARESHETGD